AAVAVHGGTRGSGTGLAVAVRARSAYGPGPMERRFPIREPALRRGPAHARGTAVGAWIPAGEGTRQEPVRDAALRSALLRALHAARVERADGELLRALAEGPTGLRVALRRSLVAGEDAAGARGRGDDEAALPGARRTPAAGIDPRRGRE